MVNTVHTLTEGWGPEQRGGGSSVFESLVRGGSFNIQLPKGVGWVIVFVYRSWDQVRHLSLLSDWGSNDLISQTCFDLFSTWQVGSDVSVRDIRLWSHMDSSWSKQRRNAFSKRLETVYGELTHIYEVLLSFGLPPLKGKCHLLCCYFEWPKTYLYR